MGNLNIHARMPQPDRGEAGGILSVTMTTDVWRVGKATGERPGRVLPR
jgi:hypothetical protein